MTALHELDATAQAQGLRAGEFSSVELVRHHLERVDTLGPALGAFITVTAEQALAAAEEADALLREGRGGPFTGVPTAIKDLTAQAGVPMSMGSAVMRSFVPQGDAHVVSLLKQAGFISLGKTNTPEFGLSSYTDNDVVGPARTPWDLARNAGGSSGGAAAAVAAGLVPVAQGSDGGGSIRIPASACGVFGFKPSRGRISAGPFGSNWNGLATDGPITRSVRDAAALMDVLARPMPGDSRISAQASSYVGALGQVPERLRIAAWTGTHLDGIEPGPDAVEAQAKAATLLRDLGHEVVEIDNPFNAELEAQFNIVWSAGMAAAQFSAEDEATLRANTRYWRARGAQASAADLAAAMQYLDLTCSRILAGLADFDLFLTPTLGLPPQRVEWFNESGDPATDHRRELQFTPYTALYNMSGQPAASFPLHWTPAGLPVGIMLAGHPGADALVLQACQSLENSAGIAVKPVVLGTKTPKSREG